MSTKLEAMVGLLAGRQVDARLLEELDDPSSEASRFLEATRDRSRALLGELGPRGRPEGGGRPPGDRRWLIVLAVVVAGLLIALGLLSWAAEARLRRLEAGLSASQAEARSSASRLEAALGRLADVRPPVVSLGPIEDALGKLDRRMEGWERGAGPTKPDPMIAQTREEIVQFRREISAIEKGAARRAEELQASIHESARLLRLLISQGQPPATTPDRTPQALPPRPTPGLENRRLTP